eukprot:CAMPEP_0201552954 /NCGR_PEP_ID=MMETSP0173_2-20130828/19359_1 /ASSEMBLY_ACC=CAM_ASM_000268 /TAXON_ID=218659 /ORGANISM="Vexillifera sp., Strain DIVA3 564/2" /LENGTH=161 /DNA_ID=CAMNT_0047963545 /DNA_START=201 /DNA_END=686 /DNA_ORIENTATION=+
MWNEKDSLQSRARIIDGIIAISRAISAALASGAVLQAAKAFEFGNAPLLASSAVSILVSQSLEALLKSRNYQDWSDRCSDCASKYDSLFNHTRFFRDNRLQNLEKDEALNRVEDLLSQKLDINKNRPETFDKGSWAKAQANIEQGGPTYDVDTSNEASSSN